ncbi:MAG: hypothetical protein FWF63_02160 [Fibromonadales bacterium]|nr:hypothetical protein [Fibromonadales bacterium]
MVLRFFMLWILFLFVSCTDVERDDPDDPKSKYYMKGVSSSSSVGAAVPSSSSQITIIRGPSVDYGGESYKTVKIGTQTWFARNLNYEVPGSKCGNGRNLVDKDTETCDTYGRLYNWATAMALDASCNSGSISCASQINSEHRGICPSGWHIPSNADWETLMRFVSPDPGTKLKAAGGWNAFGSAPKGTDDFGFSALPGGGGFDDGTRGTSKGGSTPTFVFGTVGDRGYWWSASEGEVSWGEPTIDGQHISHLDNSAYYCQMDYNSEDLKMSTPIYKDNLYSVRCVQDSP